MHHFFVTPDQVAEERIYIEGSDVNHMKNVLRMKIGEQVEISCPACLSECPGDIHLGDGNNLKYLCQVAGYEEERAVLDILKKMDADTELASRLYLFQGLPKSDKMELIVQKAVELGAYEVVPVATKRAVVKLDAKKAAKKVERWNSIAESAAKQAGRSRIPQVADVVSFKEALQMAQELDVRLIPYELAEGMEQAREAVRSIRSGQSVGIFIGPEGGFEQSEVEEAMEAGVIPITLGRRILRTETAGLAILSILMFALEEQ